MSLHVGVIAIGSHFHRPCMPLSLDTIVIVFACHCHCPCMSLSLHVIACSLRTGSFAQELGKREKKEKVGGGGGERGGRRGRERERENEPAGMTFKQHLHPPVEI